MSTPDQRTAITAKILKLCYGNKETAIRLFAKKRSQFPAKSEIWVLSMVLWDLERGMKAIQPAPTQYTPPGSHPPQSQANISPYDNPLESPAPNDYAPINPDSQQYQQPSQTVIPTPYLKRPEQPKQPAPVAIPNSLPTKYIEQAKPARSTHYSSAIETKLIRLCQGDRKVAMRLVEHTRNMFPGRDEQWIWEKACWDLERDRH